jgi:hypothetical protein
VAAREPGTNPLNSPVFLSREVADERQRRHEENLSGFEKRVDQKFDATEKAVAAALAAAKEAVTKAETASEKRFESVNEFRDQQRDMIATFLPRAEFDILIRTIGTYLPRAEFDALAKRFEQMAGQVTGKKDLVGWIFGLVGMVAAVIAIFWK